MLWCNRKDWVNWSFTTSHFFHTNSFVRKKTPRRVKANALSVYGSVTSTNYAFFTLPHGYYSNCKYTVFCVPTEEFNRADVVFFSAKLYRFFFFTSFWRMARAICCMAFFSAGCYWCCCYRCGCCCCLLSWDQLNDQRPKKIFSSTVCTNGEMVDFFEGEFRNNSTVENSWEPSKILPSKSTA